jgi:hypothetical protein
MLQRPVIVVQAKHCAPAHCRGEPSTGSAVVPDIFGGIAPFSNTGYPYELEKQISYVFTPDFPTSDVEKLGFSTERGVVWFLSRNCKVRFLLLRFRYSCPELQAKCNANALSFQINH